MTWKMANKAKTMTNKIEAMAKKAIKKMIRKIETVKMMLKIKELRLTKGVALKKKMRKMVKTMNFGKRSLPTAQAPAAPTPKRQVQSRMLAVSSPSSLTPMTMARWRSIIRASRLPKVPGVVLTLTRMVSSKKIGRLTSEIMLLRNLLRL